METYGLKNIPFFTEMDEETLEKLKHDMYIKKFKEQSIVFYEGEKSEYLHILLKGCVRLYKTTPDGKQIEMHRFKAPMLIAEYACLEQMPFPASCESLTDVEIGLLHFDLLYKYLDDAAFSLQVIKSLTKKLKLLSSHIHRESVLSSKAKVADLLLTSPEVFATLKNTEIALILNITAETLSRVLTRFKKENIIKEEKKNITILNPELLQMLVETNKL